MASGESLRAPQLYISAALPQSLKSRQTTPELREHAHLAAGRWTCVEMRMHRGPTWLMPTLPSTEAPMLKAISNGWLTRRSGTMTYLLSSHLPLHPLVGAQARWIRLVVALQNGRTLHAACIGGDGSEASGRRSRTGTYFAMHRYRGSGTTPHLAAHHRVLLRAIPSLCLNCSFFTS